MDIERTIQKNRMRLNLKKFIYFSAISICFWGCGQNNSKNHNIIPPKTTDMNQENISKAIIAIEKTALDQLNKGNPSGYLKIYAEDITYFDPFQEKRFDGLQKVQTFYNNLQGTINVEHYEMIAPEVQVFDKIAILSYNLISHIGNNEFREKCTEVYRQESDEQWKIVHSHWSLVQPADGKE
jgi:ketosteroid isomerase-like protein